MQINILSRSASSTVEKLRSKASLITFRPQKNIQTYQVKQREIAGDVLPSEVAASCH